MFGTKFVIYIWDTTNWYQQKIMQSTRIVINKRTGGDFEVIYGEHYGNLEAGTVIGFRKNSNGKYQKLALEKCANCGVRAVWYGSNLTEKPIILSKP